MLQALLHDKLARYLLKSPYEIEDLLTSVVFGCCSYLDPELALLPFLRAAKNETDEPLGPLLGPVEDVQYEFWPEWCSGDSEDAPSSSESPPMPFSGEASQEEGPTALPRRAQPELLLRIRRRDASHALVLVEAKLLSGKSSAVTPAGPVSDQLGKYWLLLRATAEREKASASAIAVVYVTRESMLPGGEFQDTQKELSDKGQPPAPLYWLSWRHFDAHVRPVFLGQAKPPAMLRDVLGLLVDKWGMAEVKMGRWPQAPSSPMPVWRFRFRWPWPEAPTRLPVWAFTRRG